MILTTFLLHFLVVVLLMHAAMNPYVDDGEIAAFVSCPQEHWLKKNKKILVTKEKRTVVLNVHHHYHYPLLLLSEAIVKK